MLQILCKADFDVLFERFERRNESGELHPGRVDRSVTYEKYRKLLDEGKYEALDLGGPVFEVDTTDFGKIDYRGLLAAIRSEINRE